MNLEDLRREYTRHGLLEGEVADQPLDQFRRWFREALDAGLDEPNAMTLATVDAEGRAKARIVLLKGVDERGFRFFTNYESHKGRELAGNPEAGLVFFWAALERQVRVEGRVEQIPTGESDAYFASRPRESRLGAWASDQSRPLAGRDELDAQAERIRTRFDGQEPIPRPEHWGGFVLRPRRVEFWQGRPARLHDRLVYEQCDTGGWDIVRLSP
ncbi:MAG: pyridoxamine 5'-phosphate oxidase [Planctomycetota bacterium]